MSQDIRPHVKEGKIKYTRGYRSRLIIGKLINLLLGLIPIAGLVVVALAFTSTSIKTESGKVNYDKISSLPKINETVVAVPGSSGVFAPLVDMFGTNKVIQGEIIAGPYGTVTVIGDEVIITHGKDSVNTNLSDIDHEYLVEEFVLRDSSGNDFIVSRDEIRGLTK